MNGTDGYAAPEREGNESVDTYAFGLLLLQLIEGRAFRMADRPDSLKEIAAFGAEQTALNARRLTNFHPIDLLRRTALMCRENRPSDRPPGNMTSIISAINAAIDQSSAFQWISSVCLNDRSLPVRILQEYLSW